jgi:SMP-30/Gluconolactonase/LRE-like region
LDQNNSLDFVSNHPTRRSCPAQYRSRSIRHSTFPVALRGNASAKCTAFGTLNPPIRSPAHAMIEAASAAAPCFGTMFADLRGDEPGVPDGMKVDTKGNVYCGGAGGIWIMHSKGKKPGRIVHGAPAATNVAFGGDDWKALYFTIRTSLGSVNVKIPGIPVPAPKR